MGVDREEQQERNVWATINDARVVAPGACGAPALLSQVGRRVCAASKRTAERGRLPLGELGPTRMGATAAKMVAACELEAKSVVSCCFHR